MKYNDYNKREISTSIENQATSLADHSLSQRDHPLEVVRNFKGNLVGTEKSFTKINQFVEPVGISSQSGFKFIHHLEVLSSNRNSETGEESNHLHLEIWTDFVES